MLRYQKKVWTEVPDESTRSQVYETLLWFDGAEVGRGLCEWLPETGWVEKGPPAGFRYVAVKRPKSISYGMMGRPSTRRPSV